MRDQHGVISHAQLIGRGLTKEAIKHRLRTGRLHPLHRGVYSVGRADVTRLGRLMAAVLACGPGGVLSGPTAAGLWGLLSMPLHRIEVTMPLGANRKRPGIRVRRRALRAVDVTTHHGIPVTTPVRTLIDLALFLDDPGLERAVNEADKLDLVDPESLRVALDDHAGVAGVPRLRRLLGRHTFTLTDSALERLFLPIAREAGLPKPLTQQKVNGYRVDFFWPDLGLVVETDGLRYHRTPSQQARDRARDQAHSAAGLSQLRFTHDQVRFEPDRVERVLNAVARRLQAPGAA